MSNVWDQLENEPSRWYDRFERYRLMGSSRSLLSVYNEERDKARKGASIPGAWQEASEQYQWKSRAEAWDASERERRREADETLYRAALDRHRDTAIKLAQSTLNNAVRILQQVDGRLKKMEAGQEEIPLKLLPAFLRAAAAVAEVSLNSEAQALAVDELIRQMGQDDGADAG